MNLKYLYTLCHRLICWKAKLLAKNIYGSILEAKLLLFTWPKPQVVFESSFCWHTMAIFLYYHSKHTTHYALYKASPQQSVDQTDLRTSAWCLFSHNTQKSQTESWQRAHKMHCQHNETRGQGGGRLAYYNPRILSLEYSYAFTHTPSDRAS